MTTAANVQATTVNLDLYVAVGVGSDTNAGTTSAAPLATYDAAIRKIPFEIKHRVIVHLANGTYLLGQTIGPKAMDAPIFVYGDGAGQPGQDGFTELVASAAAQAGSGSSVVVTGGGMTVNAYRGKTILITSGAANGDRRTIRDNTAVNIVPDASFSAAVAQNDTYRIVEPAVIIELQMVSSSGGVPDSSDLIPIVRNCGNAGAQPLDLDTFANPPPPGIYLANLRYKTRAGDADNVAVAAFVNSAVFLQGVELISDTNKNLRVWSDIASVCYAGIDYYTAASTSMSLRPFEAGLATGRRSWLGWGVSSVGAAGGMSYRSLFNFIGYLCASAVINLEGAQWRMMGGSIISTSQSCLNLFHWTRFFFSGGTPVALIRLELNTSGSAAIDVFGGAQLELTGVTIEKQDQGFCVEASASGSGSAAVPGVVGINGTVTFTGVNVNTAPTGAIAVLGGYVNSRSDPTFGGFTTGTQLSVRTGSSLPGTVIQQCDMADLNAAGNVLPTPPANIVFLANGLLAGFVDAAAAGTFDPAAMFDGIREVSRFGLIDTIRLTQVVDGGGGTTAVEVFRRRAAANTSLGVASLASGGGVFATATLTPASVALRTLLVGDLVVVQFNTRQTTTAANVTIQILGDGTDGRFGWIRRA